ncbi:hypothetical protein OSSY52_17070 [Tepiditoga spiralis]|uniref:Adhesin domain-containing protein n=1 Tax=Tepiditoga spiralis TaxID=2108365 RepID=A0A7G1G837_9BACT|nr:hypothetical protein [Tepiditoga spiralis]BBE31566.1 hypothetical protein OSSY52_17070 [Tepiditoga spiralis]
MKELINKLFIKKLIMITVLLFSSIILSNTKSFEFSLSEIKKINIESNISNINIYYSEKNSLICFYENELNIFPDILFKKDFDLINLTETLNKNNPFFLLKKFVFNSNQNNNSLKSGTFTVMTNKKDDAIFVSYKGNIKLKKIFTNYRLIAKNTIGNIFPFSISSKNIYLENVNGKILSNNFISNGELEIKNDRGDIDLKNFSNTVFSKIINKEGNIKLTASVNKMYIKNVFGNISLYLKKFNKCEINQSFGTTLIVLNKNQKYDYEIQAPNIIFFNKNYTKKLNIKNGNNKLKIFSKNTVIIQDISNLD